jgi:hypothetical protein
MHIVEIIWQHILKEISVHTGSFLRSLWQWLSQFLQNILRRIYPGGPVPDSAQIIHHIVYHTMPQLPQLSPVGRIQTVFHKQMIYLTPKFRTKYQKKQMQIY